MGRKARGARRTEPAGHVAAAQPAANESTPNQKDSGSEPAKNENEKGPDNNKRLAFLEERVPLLYGAVFALAGRFATDMELAPATGEDPVDTSLRIINQIAALEATPAELAALKRAEAAEARLTPLALFLAANGVKPDREDGAGYDDPIGVSIEAMRSAFGRLDLLTEGLSARPNFEFEGDESSVVAALRLIAELDAELASVREAANAVLDVIDQAETPEGLAAAEAREAFDLAVNMERAVAGRLRSTAIYQLRAADGDSFIASVPAIRADAADFIGEGERPLYNRPISFDPGAPPATVTAVWLIGEDFSVRCEIPGGLRVGAGAQAMIPAGHLIF